MKMRGVPFAFALVAMLAASAARALPPEEKAWEIQAAFYVWAAGMHSDVEADDVTTSIDKSFFDILDDLGWALMGGAEARYARALLMVDFVGMQLVTDADGGPRTVDFALPGPLATPGALTVGPVDVRTRVTQWMVDAKLGARVLSLPIGPDEDVTDRRRVDFDVLAGVRYWNVHVKSDVEVAPASLTVNGNPVSLPGILPGLDFGDVELPGPFLRGTDRVVEDTVQWVDPIVGFRVRGDATDRLSLWLLGDIGGWGWGDASDLTWQGVLGAAYELSDHWSATAAYRAVGLRRGDGFDGNTILYGPQLGVVFRF
jgi:hypothetical protein